MLFYFIVTPIVGLILGFFIRILYAKLRTRAFENQSKTLLQEALEFEKKIRLEKNQFLETQAEELRKIDLDRQKLYEKEKSLYKRESDYQKLKSKTDQYMEEVRSQKKQIEIESNQVNKKLRQLQNQEVELREKLQKISQLSEEQAKKLLIQEMESHVEKEMTDLILKKEFEMKEKSDEIGRKILLDVIQRIASETVVETSLATIMLPNEEMKGRIIGKEGRNIRVLEMITGVDIIIDETPGAIVVSCFDPIRKEIAKNTLEVLVKDGRIQPTRIEEVYKKCEQKLVELMKKEGESVCYDLGFQSMHPEVKKHIGYMKLRTSYGQNLLMHSIEVAQLAALLAGELNLDIQLAKRGGLLHDIGKVVMDDPRGHVQVGAELTKKYGENESVLNCILAHHEEIEHSCLESLIVKIADTISAARPGARKDNVERYIQRLENLEKIALNYPETEKAFAIQAGRELRVFVNSSEISDEQSKLLARKIATEIEDTLKYPGTVRVTVIRETRATEYAK